MNKNLKLLASSITAILFLFSPIYHSQAMDTSVQPVILIKPSGTKMMMKIDIDQKLSDLRENLVEKERMKQNDIFQKDSADIYFNDEPEWTVKDAMTQGTLTIARPSYRYRLLSPWCEEENIDYRHYMDNTIQPVIFIQPDNRNMVMKVNVDERLSDLRPTLIEKGRMKPDDVFKKNLGDIYLEDESIWTVKEAMTRGAITIGRPSYRYALTTIPTQVGQYPISPTLSVRSALEDHLPKIIENFSANPSSG